MRWSEKMTKMGRRSKVLEIGFVGFAPVSQAHTVLEIGDESGTGLTENGEVRTTASGKRSACVFGAPFPFADREFDYVICCDVIQSIPEQFLGCFFGELQRVARAGFFEYPTCFLELIRLRNPHLWFVNHRGNKVLLLRKDVFRGNFVQRVFAEMFGDNNARAVRWLNWHAEVFWSAFEWEDKLEFEIVASFDDLIDIHDYNRFKLLLARVREAMPIRSYAAGRIRLLWSRVLKYFASAFRMRHGFFVDSTAQLERKQLIEIKKRAEIQDHVIIRTYENPVIIGECSQINPFTVIYGGSGVYIGNDVMIAPHCMIAAGNHDFRQIDKPIRHAGNLTKGPIVIEDGVWVGANATICDGVTIGRHAVVGANSVVTKDVAPYDIVGGVPARVIGNRQKLAAQRTT